MKIAEYKQIDVEVIEETVIVVDTDGNGEVIGEHEEVVTKEIPIYGTVYRDMTDEEVAEIEKVEFPPNEPTFEDRIEAQVMFTALMTDTLLEEGDM